MIQIQNLTLVHSKDQRILLEDFSCTLNEGDKAVLIGEEGDGKSTLLKWIADPHLVESYVSAEGRRILNNEHISYLPQELPAEDADLSVYEYFSSCTDFYDLTPGELSALALPCRVGDDFYYRDQKMRSLSGGERIKAQLLRIQMQRPTALLMDEPSNDIDLETLEWLESFIRSWSGIVLFVSHDEMLIRRTANVIIHLEQVERKTKSHYTIVRSDYDTYIENREDAFGRQAQQAENDRRERKLRDERYRRIRDKVVRAQAGVSRQDPHTGALLKKKMHAVKALEHRFVREDENVTKRPDREEAMYFRLGSGSIPNGKVVLDLDIQELKVGAENAEDSKVLARNIHLTVRGAEKVCIIGVNGAGKSTLIRHIYDSMKNRHDIRLEYMPQNYEELLDLDSTPAQYLATTGDKEEISRIRTFLGSMRYTADEMNHPIRELSGGQKAKIFLLKMSLSDPDVLILDEPTRNFSPLSNPVIRRMFRGFGGAIISVSHDRMWMSEVVDTLYLLTPDGLQMIEMEDM